MSPAKLERAQYNALYHKIRTKHDPTPPTLIKWEQQDTNIFQINEQQMR